jgi:hypothetical protein
MVMVNFIDHRSLAEELGNVTQDFARNIQILIQKHHIVIFLGWISDDFY